MTRNEKNEITERAPRHLNETDFEVEIDENEEWFTDFKAPFQSLQDGELTQTFCTYKRQKRSD